MLGYGPDEIGDDPDAWFARVHPEDLPGLRRTLDACLAGLRTPFHHQYRVIDREGAELWVACRGAGIVGAEGGVVRIAGSQTDITSSKRAEADLSKRNPRCAHGLAEPSPIHRSLEAGHRSA